MFKVKIKDSKLVRGIFDAVSGIISEAQLEVDPAKGIGFSAMDTGHICLVSLDLRKEDLDEFKADEKSKIGLNLEDLVKILKRSGIDDEITFSYSSTEKQLIIEMRPPTAKKARRFTMGLMDIEAEEYNVESLEELQFDNHVCMNLKYLDEAIKDAEIYAEMLEIRVTDKLIFTTVGTIGNVQGELEKDMLDSADFTNESHGFYAIKLLKEVLKVSSIADKAEISLKSDMPLKLKFNLLNSSRILYFLAPRAEEEEDTTEFEE